MWLDNVYTGLCVFDSIFEEEKKYGYRLEINVTDGTDVIFSFLTVSEKLLFVFQLRPIG